MKSRRDITLGEMQDECSFRGDNCETIGGDKCKFFELCATMQTIDKGCLTPIMWNLTDPPRFNEAQMAFWRAWYNIGARNVAWSGREVMYLVQGETNTLTRQFGKITMVLGGEMGLSTDKPLDLTELLGKDAT